MEFWTSDTHFGHTNVIKYGNRPFLTSWGSPDVELMDRTMTERWNATVSPNDTVFHLGDFSLFGGVGRIEALRKQLNGRVFLVRGNHDQKPSRMLRAGFDEVHNNLTIERLGYRIYLNHIPIVEPDPERQEPAPLRLDQRERKYRSELLEPPPFKYDYFLCGHVHANWRRRGNVINVGVDVWNFTPQSLDALLNAERDP